MTEQELERAVVEAARLLGWLVAHFRPARTAEGWRTPVAADGTGFPDLVLARPGALVFVELKATRGRLSEEQSNWLRVLGLTGACDAHVWRPDDWQSGVIEEVLRTAVAALEAETGS